MCLQGSTVQQNDDFDPESSVKSSSEKKKALRGEFFRHHFSYVAALFILYMPLICLIHLSLGIIR